MDAFLCGLIWWLRAKYLSLHPDSSARRGGSHTFLLRDVYTTFIFLTSNFATLTPHGGSSNRKRPRVMCITITTCRKEPKLSKHPEAADCIYIQLRGPAELLTLVEGQREGLKFGMSERY